jgi:hypothetical protein
MSALPMSQAGLALNSNHRIYIDCTYMDRQDDIMAQAPKSTQKKTPAAGAAKTAKTATTSKKAPESKSAPGIRRVAIIGGNRLPFARSNTAYS